MNSKTAYNYSISLITRQDYSEYKMRKKLSEREYDEEEIDETIEKLFDQNYLREEEYTRQRIKGMLVKGYANRHILQKLKSEHLEPDESIINEIRSEQGFEVPSEVNRLIDKKLRYKEIPTDYEGSNKLKQKVLRFLLSKGYSYQESNDGYNQYILENE